VSIQYLKSGKPMSLPHKMVRVTNLGRKELKAQYPVLKTTSVTS